MVAYHLGVRVLPPPYPFLCAFSPKMRQLRWRAFSLGTHIHISIFDNRTRLRQSLSCQSHQEIKISAKKSKVKHGKLEFSLAPLPSVKKRQNGAGQNRTPRPSKYGNFDPRGMHTFLPLEPALRACLKWLYMDDPD